MKEISNTKINKKYYVTKVFYFFIVVSLIANFALVYMYITAEKNHSITDVSKYPLLSKRIFTKKPNDIIINFVPLKRVLVEYIKSQKNIVGLYFEYLPSGVSIGINDKEEFNIVSLSKVPLVMSVLRKVEKGKMSLDDIIVIKKENLNSEFGSLWKRGEGAKVSVKELVEICLKESDNTAYNASI